MDPEAVEAYLSLLGIAPDALLRRGTAAATAAAAVAAAGVPALDSVTAIARRHFEHVPFENLAFHLDEPLPCDEEAVVARFVAGRGGICYQLNGGLCALLGALGFAAALHGGRVLRRDPARAGAVALGPPLGHAAVVVRCPEPWVLDVGFAGEMVVAPLASPPGDAGGSDADADADAEVELDGEVVYLLERRPRPLADFEAMCWWQRTAPGSRFAAGPICSRATPGGRVTIAGDRLIRVHDGARSEAVLGDDALLAAYREHFGIALDRLPRRRASPAAGVPTAIVAADATVPAGAAVTGTVGGQAYDQGVGNGRPA